VLTLSPVKLFFIVAVALVLLGPDKLPEMAHKLGTLWRSLKSIQQKVEAEVREAIPNLPSTSDLARVVRSPVNLLNTLADRVDEPVPASATPTAGDGFPDPSTMVGTPAVDDGTLAHPPTPPNPPTPPTPPSSPFDPSLN
jgi:Sec-independent protein translocase protein TatA